MLANRAELDPRVRFVATRPTPSRSSSSPSWRAGRQGDAQHLPHRLQEFTEDEFLLAVRFGDAAALAVDNAHIRASLERQAQTDPLTGLWNHRASTSGCAMPSSTRRPTSRRSRS